ncbi:hypothetical protein [Bifidobacterium eulemuris]|nr:hypothetical protein [Bifidobacterium eulemuris]
MSGNERAAPARSNQGGTKLTVYILNGMGGTWIVKEITIPVFLFTLFIL